MIACSEKKSKDQLKSDFVDIRNYSGWIAEPAMAAPDSIPDPDVHVATQLAMYAKPMACKTP